MPVFDDHGRDGGLEAAGGAEEVAGHGLGRADGDLVGRARRTRVLMAMVSVLSPTGVDVPWALM